MQISAQDEVEEMPRLLLNHDSSTKLAWDIFMMILIIFSAFADPVQIGETEDEPAFFLRYDSLVVVHLLEETSCHKSVSVLMCWWLFYPFCVSSQSWLLL